MSTSRHIDIICFAAALLAIVITVLFMNGEALGITPLADEDAGDGMFTENDLNAGWDTSGATYITLTGDGGNIAGNGAYAYGGDIYIVYAGKYVLSGELTDGSVIVNADGDDKIWLLVDGVALNCSDGAAIRVEQAEKVFLTLAEGTENTVSCGEVYSADIISSGVDGAIYSRDDLTINGSGSLSVTAGYSHGIVCNDDLVITGGNIAVEAVQDGLHANDSVRIAEAELTISAGDDGITVSNDDNTAFLYVGSGTVTILSCYEGLEATDVTIAGGVIDIAPTDDGINANGSGADSAINITGGDITIINPTGRDADGLDSNGSIYISGGTVFISVTADGGSCALDYGSENGGVCEISGGTVVACGSSMMAEGFSASSTQGFIMYSVSAAASGTVLTLEDAEGNVLVSEEIPCSFSSAVISTPGMQTGDVCTVTAGNVQEQVTVGDSSVYAAAGRFGMTGGGMQRGGGRGEIPGGQWDRETMPSDVRPDNAQDMPAMPEDGAQAPDGMEPRGNAEASAGAEMPAGGMQMEQREDMQEPEGTELPESMERPGSMQTPFGTQPGTLEDTGAQQTAKKPPDMDVLILLGVTVLVMAAGLLFAWRFRQR